MRSNPFPISTALQNSGRPGRPRRDVRRASFATGGEQRTPHLLYAEQLSTGRLGEQSYTDHTDQTGKRAESRARGTCTPITSTRPSKEAREPEPRTCRLQPAVDRRLRETGAHFRAQTEDDESRGARVLSRQRSVAAQWAATLPRAASAHHPKGAARCWFLAKSGSRLTRRFSLLEGWARSSF